MKAIWKREIRGYFLTPVGYVFLGVFLTVSSVLFYLSNLATRSGDLPSFISRISYLWMLLSPVLTMRLLAEERQKKTDQLLLTSPVSLPGIVGGKYLAAVTVLLTASVLTLVYVGIIAMYGTVYPAELAVNYLGFILLGCAFAAVDLFLSSCAASPVTAAVMAFGANFLLWMVDLLEMAVRTEWISSALRFVSLYHRNEPFLMGQLSFANIFYDLAFIAVFLMLTVYRLDRRRNGSGIVAAIRTRRLLRKAEEAGETGAEAGKERLAGGGSLLMAGAVTVSLILLCIGADRLEKQNGWRVDCSFNSVTTTGDTTREVLRELPHDVHIWALFRKGYEDAPLLELLDRYGAESRRITWEQADPTLHPELIHRFSTPLEVPQEGGLIVYSGDTGRWQLLAQEDFAAASYRIDQETGETEVSFDGLTYERSITGAIDYVTREHIPQAVILQGHEELTESDVSAFTELLRKNRYEVSVQTLSDPAYTPDPQDLLIFFSPMRDLTGDEFSRLKAFADAGGSFLFTRDFTDPVGNMPNYTALLRSYGFICLDGIVKADIREEGTYLDGNPANLIPQMLSTDITYDLIASGANQVLLPNAAAFEMPPEQTDRNLTVGVVLQSSAASYLKNPAEYEDLAKLDQANNADEIAKLVEWIRSDNRTERDTAGPFALALQARRVTGAGYVSRAFIIGCSPALTNADSLTILASEQLIIRTMEFLLDLEASDLEIMQRQAVRPGLGVGSLRTGTVLLTALPAAVLFAALLVLKRRRGR